MTTLPTWAVYAVSFGAPGAAFLGVLVAQWLTRKGARELETRSRREETMRNLRWAAELAVNKDDRMADLGVNQLAALLESDLLNDAELEELGEDAEAIQYVEDVDVVGE